jgi:signal transduction histidine kinase
MPEGSPARPVELVSSSPTSSAPSLTPESFLLLTARSPYPSLLLSVDGRILASNASASRLVGRSPAGRSLQEIATGDPAELEEALHTWSTAGVAVGRPLRITVAAGRDRLFRGEGLRVMTAGRDPVSRILLHCVPLDPLPRRCGGRPPGTARNGLAETPREDPPDAADQRPTRPAELQPPRERAPHARAEQAGREERAAPSQVGSPDPGEQAGPRVVGKMEAMGNLAAGIAHDFNNLLTVMKAEIELSQEHPGLPGLVLESLAATHDAIHQAEGLVAGLLAFSRRQLVRVVTLDLRALVAEVIERTRPEIAGRGVDLALEPSPDPLPVTGDRAQMEVVLTALVQNARDAVGGSGLIRVRTRREEVDADFVRRNPGSTEGTFAVLEVVDDGVGIAPEIRGRLFEPFFTTKGRGAGRGLGLAQAFGIVKALSGYLRVESVVGGGATFTVYLPLADPARAARPGHPARPQTPGDDPA